jgi:hypothetical protein
MHELRVGIPESFICISYFHGSSASYCCMRAIVNYFPDTYLGESKLTEACWQRPRETRRGQWGHVPPNFLKVKKVPFFWAKVPHLKNEKSISRHVNDMKSFDLSHIQNCPFAQCPSTFEMLSRPLPVAILNMHT